MSIMLRLTPALALTCFFFTASAFAQQIRQPASMLPIESLEPQPQQEIVAPQSDTVPQWLLRATESPARKSNKSDRGDLQKALQTALPLVETENFAVLGQLLPSYPQRQEVTPSTIAPSEDSEEGSKIRFLGTRRTQNPQSPKRF